MGTGRVTPFLRGFRGSPPRKKLKIRHEYEITRFYDIKIEKICTAYLKLNRNKILIVVLHKEGKNRPIGNYDFFILRI